MSVMFNDEVIDRKIQDLAAEFHPQTMIETGTWKGQGTLCLSQYFPLVVSIEIIQQNWEDATNNIRASGYPWYWQSADSRAFHAGGRWIILYRGDSPQVLREILRPALAIPRPIFFLLDAHWHAVWPLINEINAIAESGVPDSVILIHDFKTPDGKFGYDSYRGQDLDLDYVREPLLRVNPNYKFSWNTESRMVPGTSEARGGPRGILYATPS